MKTISLLVIAIFCTSMVWAQSNQQLSIPLIGSTAPSFKANSTDGKLNFPKDFGENWKVLFSHPRDFTPVCTSEILELAYIQKDFDRLGVKIAIISTDEVSLHQSWKGFMEKLNYKDRGPQKINFPFFEDVNGAASIKYGMLHEIPGNERDVRGVYIIDSKNIVRSINFYPIEIGRNMQEVVRIIEALQTTDEQMVLTPANWNVGDDLIIPYRPFLMADYELNPEKFDKDYYNLEDMVWFKKGTKNRVLGAAK